MIYPLPSIPGCYGKQAAAQWYAGDGAEFHGNLNMSTNALAKKKKARSLPSCAGTSAASAAVVEAGVATSECPTELHGWQDPVSAASDASIKDLVKPFLHKYGVDVYLAGHWHYYGTLLATACSHPFSSVIYSPVSAL